MTTHVICDDYPPLDGGVATWAQTVARGLRDAGEPVVVWARARDGLVSEDGLLVRGVRGPSFGRRGGLWMVGAMGWRLRSGDRVLATTWAMATQMVGLCRAVGAELHVVFHGSDLTRAKPNDRGLQKVLDGAHRRWCVSEHLQKLLESRGAQSEVLPSPVDVGRASEPDASRWVLVSRATELKGGDRFLGLVAEAGVRADVVGDGPALTQWRAIAKGAGAQARFHGRLPRAEVAEVLRGAGACFLLPRTHRDGSGAEGLGLSLLEGAALGVPGVGCKTGGVPEALGPHGLVLSNPDDAAGSVAAIRAWWRPELGEQARAWLAAHHGAERTVAALLR